MKMELHEIVAKLKELFKDFGRTPTLRESVKSGISKKQIDKHGYNNLVIKAGLTPNFMPYSGYELEGRKPRVLFFDIETSAIKAHVWAAYDQNVSLDQMIEDWYVLSWSAKWMGEDKIYYEDVRNSNNKKLDKGILPGIHKLLCEADIVVGHNSDKFDIKKLNARFLKYDMVPVSPYRSIDTLKICKKYFKLTYNTLKFVAIHLGLSERKSEHGKFPGMKLWNECMKWNKSAFMEMERYNKQDVVVLEKIFNKLVPYESSLKFSAFLQRDACSCGGDLFAKDGINYTATGAFQRYRCKKCGKIFSRKDNLISKETRKELMK